MKEEKILDFLEEFGTLSEGMSDEQRVELMTSMLEKLPQEDQDAILNYCSSEEDCECDCEEEIDDDEMKELKLYEKQLEVTLTEKVTVDELNRIDAFKEDYEVDEVTKSSELYLNGMVEAKTFIAMTKELINKGNIDVNNAYVIASNYLNHVHNIEMSKVNVVNNSMNQI